MSINQKIFKCLDKCKYFGLRFLYYRFLIKFFPFLNMYLLDIIQPSMVSRYLSAKAIGGYWGFIGHGAENEPPYPGLGMVHYVLVRSLKPERILCVGSYRGFIPVVLGLACQDNRKGVVDFVDAGLDFSNIDPLLGDGFWKKVDSDKYFSKLVDPRHINSYVITTQEYAKKFPKRRYGYIYLDGDHTYQGVKKDYQLFWPKLELGGFLVFHDVLGKGKKVKFGVKRFWEELSGKDKIIIPFPPVSGLGILQKT